MGLGEFLADSWPRRQLTYSETVGNVKGIHLPLIFTHAESSGAVSLSLPLQISRAMLYPGKMHGDVGCF